MTYLVATSSAEARRLNHWVNVAMGIPRANGQPMGNAQPGDKDIYGHTTRYKSFAKHPTDDSWSLQMDDRLRAGLAAILPRMDAADATWLRGLVTNEADLPAGWTKDVDGEQVLDTSRDVRPER